MRVTLYLRQPGLSLVGAGTQSCSALGTRPDQTNRCPDPCIGCKTDYRRGHQDGHLWLLTANVTGPSLRMSLTVLALPFWQDTVHFIGTKHCLSGMCAALLSLGSCISDVGWKDM